LKEKNLNIWVTEPNISKKLPATVLENEFRRQGVAARCVENPRIALQQIAEKQKSSELLIVLGSHYLIGDLLNDASLMRALKK
jgi:folylpolyglutamate synthase/dihydropteroate synthase